MQEEKLCRAEDLEIADKKRQRPIQIHIQRQTLIQSLIKGQRCFPKGVGETDQRLVEKFYEICCWPSTSSRAGRGSCQFYFKLYNFAQSYLSQEERHTLSDVGTLSDYPYARKGK